ncbi:MAG TPA: DUF2934 domain-containing protein [Nitrospira sp.]
MSKVTVSNPSTPTRSTDTPKMSPKSTQTQARIALRAYELYEQRGRQEGRALEDWVNAERQLIGEASE